METVKTVDQPEFVITADGSKTIFNPEVGEHYHSRHGALQESRHVFLEAGLKFLLEKNTFKEVSALEVGFGTGLNFLLSAQYCLENSVSLNYCGIEAYPLSIQILSETGYDQYISPGLWRSFLQNYERSFRNRVTIDLCSVLKIAGNALIDFNSAERFDLIYFDAFAAIHQPEMWSERSLEHVCGFLRPGGVFVTYAITGNLKRTLKALGFAIEKAPGAPGKREMLRAVKI